MDIFNKLKDTVNAYVGTPVEQKVIEATSMDNWGTSNTIKKEIARYTFHYSYYEECVNMLWKRLDSDPESAAIVIFKTLDLISFILIHGSPRFVNECSGRQFAIAKFKNFNFHNGERDFSSSIREKSRYILNLLQNTRELEEQRAEAGQSGGVSNTSVDSSQSYGASGGSYGGGSYGGSGSGHYGQSAGSSSYGGYGSKPRDPDAPPASSYGGYGSGPDPRLNRNRRNQQEDATGSNDRFSHQGRYGAAANTARDDPYADSNAQQYNDDEDPYIAAPHTSANPQAARRQQQLQQQQQQQRRTIGQGQQNRANVAGLKKPVAAAAAAPAAHREPPAQHIDAFAPPAHDDNEDPFTAAADNADPFAEQPADPFADAANETAAADNDPFAAAAAGDAVPAQATASAAAAVATPAPPANDVFSLLSQPNAIQDNTSKTGAAATNDLLSLYNVPAGGQQQQQQQPQPFGMPPQQQNPYGMPQQQNPYGMPRQQNPYGMPQQQNPFGMPQQQQQQPLDMWGQPQPQQPQQQQQPLNMWGQPQQANPYEAAAQQAPQHAAPAQPAGGFDIFTAVPPAAQPNAAQNSDPFANLSTTPAAPAVKPVAATTKSGADPFDFDF